MPIRSALFLLLLASALLRAAGPVYVVLWFDLEPVAIPTFAHLVDGAQVQYSIEENGS